MYRIRLLLLALISTLFSFGAQAVDLSTPEAARNFANEVMLDIGQSRLPDAWAKMKSTTTIPPARIDAFASSYETAVNQSIKYFGPSIGMELVSAQTSGESLLRLTYLIKYEVTGVSWFMTFYKGRDKWVLTDFNYDINMNSIFLQ